MGPAYSSLASVYDQFMDEVDYPYWAEYLRQLIGHYPPPGNRLLDIGCGTGTLTLELHRIGFEVHGVDLAPEMLSIAADKGLKSGLGVDRWKVMDMRQLRYATDSFHVAVCACDGFNYLRTEAELGQALSSINRVLVPGGLLLFDVHSEHKMKTVFADGLFVTEGDDGYCIWTSQFKEDTGDCLHEMVIFQHLKDELFQRHFESHYQYYFSLPVIDKALAEHGFDLLAVHGWGQLTNEPSKEAERIQIVARKQGC